MPQKSKRQLEYTTATHVIERLTPSRDALRLCEQVSNGEISADTAVEMLLQSYCLKRVETNSR